MFGKKILDLHKFNANDATAAIQNILYILRHEDYQHDSVTIITGKGEGVMQTVLFDAVKNDDRYYVEEDKNNGGKFEVYLNRY